MAEQLHYSHIIEYYSALKRNELWTHTVWKDFRVTMYVKEASQKKKYVVYGSIYIKFPKKKTYSDRE